MSENNKDENRYLRRFEDEFHAIMREIGMYADVIPQYKSENESLRERITNIRSWVEAASKIRYISGTDSDAVLANLITQVLLETDRVDELKPIEGKEPDIKTTSEDLYQLLTHSRSIAMDEAFSGFDFFENNPYKDKAEKQLAKIKKKAK